MRGTEAQGSQVSIALYISTLNRASRYARTACISSGVWAANGYQIGPCAGIYSSSHLIRHQGFQAVSCNGTVYEGHVQAMMEER